MPKPDQSTGGDASDAAAEGWSSGGPEGSTGEASYDAPPKETGTGSDANGDSGCGATNTPQNCGACGQACAAGGTDGVKANGASCTGTTCTYQCATGFLDCNASAGYDPDGCECDTRKASGATCCGTACPTLHGVGVPNAANANFYDCISAGYSQQLATDACGAYFGTTAVCAGYSCNADTEWIVCGQVSSTSQCVCWEWRGPNVGYAAAASLCTCPGSNAGTNYPWQ
jgi:hypothetical protein